MVVLYAPAGQKARQSTYGLGEQEKKQVRFPTNLFHNLSPVLGYAAEGKNMRDHAGGVVPRKKAKSFDYSRAFSSQTGTSIPITLEVKGVPSLDSK